jgi:hypothetical protein
VKALPSNKNLQDRKRLKSPTLFLANFLGKLKIGKMQLIKMKTQKLVLMSITSLNELLQKLLQTLDLKRSVKKF